MNEIKQNVKDFLDSDLGKSVKTLVAFAVRKSKTQKDDEILENIDLVAEEIAANIKEVASQYPTDKEAKDAGMAILEVIVRNTETKWDDRAFAILKMFM